MRRQLDRREPLADAFDEGVVPAEEEGHIGAERDAQRHQPLSRPVELPQPVQCEQGTGRIRAAAAHAGTPGHALGDRDVGTERAAAGRLQRAGSSQAQVIGGQRGAQVVARDPAVAAPLEVQRVGPVGQHKGRLQQVVAIWAPADDMQEQVQLGRRGDLVQRLQAHDGRSIFARKVTAGAVARDATTQPSS